MSVYFLLHPDNPINKDITNQKFFEEKSIQQIILNQKNILMKNRRFYESIQNFSNSPNYLYFQVNVFSIYNDYIILFELTKKILNPNLTPGRTVGGKEHIFLTIYNEELPSDFFFCEQMQYLLYNINNDSYFKKKDKGDKELSTFLRCILLYYHHIYYNFWKEIVFSNLETYFVLSLRILCTFGFTNDFLDKIDLEPFQQISPILHHN